ncbi:MAG: T9SS C-terminal target domain-containing protein [Calditrichaeota bacterium]|nr:MAG: T9SS C-terminal target domain-containing protein [Calditrichota bacterium]
MRAFLTPAFLVLWLLSQVNAKIIFVPTDVQSIQEAVDAASTGDTVLVGTGDFQESLLIQKRLVIFGSTDGVHPTTIKTQNGHTDRLIIFSGSGADSCEFRYFSIENATGGAILCDGASPLLSSLLLSDNSSAKDGGGILCRDASPIIRNVHLEGNQSLGEGGAIAITGNSNPRIENCTITENSSSTNGGGVSCTGDGQFRIIDSTIENNHAAGKGGGIYVSGNKNSMVNNTTISTNTAASGGGVALQNGSIELINNDIIKNAATEYAGGIFCRESSLVFDSRNRNNIFDNSAKIFKDIFTNVILTAHLDTFTVAQPTSYYASILSMINFDITHGKKRQFGGELHVAATPAEAKNTGKFETIDAALASVYADTGNPAIIHLPAKRFLAAENKNGWPLFVPDHVTLRGVSAGVTILDGNNQSPLFRLENIEGVQISDMTLTKGSADDGGGICFKNTFASNDISVLFQNLIITKNSAQSQGGGVYLEKANARFENVTIRNNKAHDGGGLANELGVPFFSREQGGKNVICNNFAIQNGQDLYSPITYMNVYLHYFTVPLPTEREAYPLKNFVMIIENQCTNVTSVEQTLLSNDNLIFYPIYPNPIGSTATIEFIQPENGITEIQAFNILGQTVACVFKGHRKKGLHKLTWHPKNLENGVYFIQISMGGHTQIRRCIKLQ